LNGILKIKQNIEILLRQAAERAQREGKLPQVELPEIIIERPQNSEHGDYASSLPLKMARSTGKNPMEIAQAIVDCISTVSELESVTVARPGFVNFKLHPV
jgi:arginyl-tRNA synthetase